MKVQNEPERDGDKRVSIRCPGCYAMLKAEQPENEHLDDASLRMLSTHFLNVTRVHTFNNDYERPTFTPSLLATIRNGHVCHSYVTDGMIRYLDDCTHSMKGQTVPLLEIEK